MSGGEWADEVRVRSGIEGVPGMGPLDVDGLEPSDQQAGPPSRLVPAAC
jgi:hypothetical protein